MKAPPPQTSFPRLLLQFFLDLLIQQRKAGAQTVAAHVDSSFTAAGCTMSFGQGAGASCALPSGYPVDSGLPQPSGKQPPQRYFGGKAGRHHR